MPEPPRVAVRPADVRSHLLDAVRRGGGELVDPGAAQMLVWTDPTDVDGLVELLEGAPQIEVVQLLWAGVEPFAARGVFDDGRTWLCGKGIYAEPVAEHALTLTLGLLRLLPQRVRATSWGPRTGESLLGRNVTVLGGGGITEALVRLLAPFGCSVTVVRRSAEAMAGVDRVVDPSGTAEALSTADVVVLALALTPETRGVINAAALGTMPDHAVLVNVARGEHVDTDALVTALRGGQIAGAGLDVTDPEPLPDGHPLWHAGNVIITPHCANTEEMAVPLVSARVSDNVRRFGAGHPLVGLVDPELGY